MPDRTASVGEAGHSHCLDQPPLAAFSADRGTASGRRLRFPWVRVGERRGDDDLTSWQAAFKWSRV